VFLIKLPAGNYQVAANLFRPRGKAARFAVAAAGIANHRFSVGR
jgi:hypothetical protein